MADPVSWLLVEHGWEVVAQDGAPLGRVHEVHPHYLLVGQEGEEGEHDDLVVPVHAIRGFEGGTLRVSVTRGAVTEVEDVARPHRPGEEPR